MRGLVALALAASSCLMGQEVMHLTMQQAEDLAVKNNPVIAESEFHAKAYDEVTREFRAAYYPALRGDATAVGADSGTRLAAGGLNNPIVYDRFATGLTLSQLITDFGRTHDLVASASLNAKALHEEVSYTRADLLLRTDAAYLAVLRTHALLTIARETVRARQTVVDQVSALFQNKLRSSLDLSFANVNLADANLMLSNAENDLRAAEAQLARVLAVKSDTRFDLADPGPEQGPPPDAAALTTQALQKRPDLISRRIQVQSAQKFVQAEGALSRPTVSVMGTAGYVPAGQPQIPGTYGALGANVSIPVFNGGLFRARRLEADARAAAADKALQDYTLQVERDVRVAALDAENAYRHINLTQQLLDQAKLALDLSQARYNLGLSSIVELSQSQLLYTSAEIGRARAGYDYAAQLSILNFQAGNSR